MFTLLYVDDEPGLLELGKLFLESAGEFTVTTALSAQEGLDILAKQEFDAIVSDYQMPVMDGIELLKRVRRSFGSVPFVLFTGRGREEVVIEAINNGVDFYLQKGGDPRVQFAELALKVRQAVNRRRAETALSESENRLADIINFLPDATFAIDTRGRVIAWNRAIEEMTGVFAHDILGKGDYEYAVPIYGERRPILIDLIQESDEKLMASYTSIRHDGKTLSAETTLPAPRGRHIYALVKASPLYNRDGKITGAIESIRDITDRKKTEDALNESERRFRDLADLLPQGIYEADTTGQVTYANRVALEMYGYTGEDIGNGLDILATIAPDDRERAATAFRRLIVDGIPDTTNAEYRGMRKDGSIFPVNIFSSPITRHGTNTGIRGIIIDVTDRRRTEEEIRATNEQLVASEEELRAQYEELARSEARFRSIVESNPFPIAISSVRDGRYLLVNEAFETITGYSGPEIIGRDAGELGIMAPGDLERRKTFYGLQTTIANEVFPIVKKDGRRSTVLISFIRILFDNQPAVLTMGVDITERTLAEDALRENEAKYQALIETTGTGFVILDREGRVLDANAEYIRMTGHALLEEIAGRSVIEWTAEYDRERNAEAVRRCLEDGHLRNFVIDYAGNDGTIIPIEINAKVLASKGSDRILTLCRDVTDRRRMETELRASSVFTRALLDAVPTPVFYKDRQGRYLGCNRAFTEIMGVRQQDLEGKTVFDLWPDEMSGTYHEKDLELMDHPAHQVYEFRIRDKDGNTRPVIYAKDVFRNETGAVAGIVGAFLDITDLKQAEAALRESEEKYRTLVESSFDGILIHQDGVVVYINRTGASIYGSDDPATIIGMAALDLIAPEFRPLIAGRIREAPEKPQALIRERLLRPDGTLIDADVTTTPTTWEGKPAAYVTFRDISGQVRAEAALRESEAKYRSLVETTSDFIWEVDAHGTYTYVSPQVRQILGYEPGELVGKTPFTIMPPDEAGRVAAEFGRSVNGRLPIVALENRALRKDGSVVILETSGVVRTGPGGEYQGYRGIDRDITKRKKAEDALRESEARLSSILHGSPVLQFVIGRDHRVISWNRALEEYSGIREGEIVGTDGQWRAFYPVRRQVLADILVDGNEAALDRLYAGKYEKSRYVEGAYHATDFFPHMGGSGKWLSFTAAPVRDVHGTIIGAVETLEDVTERISAEHALRESEEWTRTILNTAQAGIVIIDAETHRIIDANKKALELIGLGRDAVVGEICHRFICPSEVGKCPVTDQYQHVDTSERVLMTAPGGTIPILKTVIPVTIHDRTMLVESFVDISDQKRSETAIREANRKLNLLNSITRHDIRNQLMVAQGFTHLAALSKPGPAIADFLAKITTAIETIDRQIEFTKTYQELGVHAPAWFPLDEIVRSVRPGTIALENTCTQKEIYADPMIDKVFFNLFDNAVKHGGRVTKVTVGCEEIDDYLVITFSDNGCGIAPNEKKKIFEKGYGKNSGLGLFLVREILSITGININENGTFGEGAAFEILVPKGAYRKAV